MKRVGIIRSAKYPHKAKHGEDIFNLLSANLADKYIPSDIVVNEDGTYLFNGKPIEIVDLMHLVDGVWNTAFDIAPLLDTLNIKHYSPPVFGSMLTESRAMLREHIENTDISVTHHIILPVYQSDIDGEIYKYAIKKAKSVFEKFGSPWLVYSFNKNSNMATHVANTFPELTEAIYDGAIHGESLVVEEIIPGDKIITHSLKNFRGQDLYIFPNDSKTLPADKINSVVQNLHNQTGAYFLRAKFIWHPKKGLFLSSIDFTPDVSHDSDLHKVAESIGAKTHNIIESILENHL